MANLKASLGFSLYNLQIGSSLKYSFSFFESIRLLISYSCYIILVVCLRHRELSEFSRQNSSLQPSFFQALQTLTNSLRSPCLSPHFCMLTSFWDSMCFCSLLAWVQTCSLLIPATTISMSYSQPISRPIMMARLHPTPSGYLLISLPSSVMYLTIIDSF